MTKFKIHFKNTSYGSCEVEADTKEEAERYFNNDSSEYTYNSEIETGHVEIIETEVDE